MAKISVAALKESVSNFDEAQASWASGQYRLALSLLSGAKDEKSLLLMARIFIRIRDFQSAMRVLATFPRARQQEALEADLLQAYAKDRLAKGTLPFSESPIGVLTSERHADPQKHPIAAYYRAIAYYMRDEIDAAVADASIALTGQSVLLRAWAVELLAWMEVSRQRLEAALSLFAMCLDLLDCQPPIDDHKRRNALHGYGMLAVEMFNVPAMERYLAEVQKIKPISGAGRLDSLVYTNAGVGHSLLGDDINAVRCLIEAIGCGPPGAFKALPNVELAAFYTRRGATAAATVHRSIARDELEATDWGKQDDEANLSLVDFAIEAADIDTAMASRFLARAQNLRGSRDPTLAFDRNGRGMALALLARGRIALAKGQKQCALQDIKAAQDIWLSLGYHYRAAVAQVDLLRLNHETATPKSLLTLYREKPKSWPVTTARAIAHKVPSPRELLSERENLVVDGICEGLSSVEIAARLGRSASTIRNQTISVYRTLGVSTRAALVALVLSEKAPPRD